MAASQWSAQRQTVLALVVAGLVVHAIVTDWNGSSSKSTAVFHTQPSEEVKARSDGGGARHQQEQQKELEAMKVKLAGMEKEAAKLKQKADKPCPEPEPKADVGGSSEASTRVLIEESEWARKSEEALRHWRASLFGRMAKQYSELEKRESNNGEVAIGRVEPHNMERYDLFNPFLNCSSGQPLTRLGSDGDGGKFICMDSYLQEQGCIVYSLGSNGQYDFEEAVLQATPCEVHTFDCTYPGRSLDNNQRHHYHQTCIGQDTAKGAAKGSAPKAHASQFMTYDAILAKLGHSRVDLLKIDIEGFEYDVFAGFKPNCGLPRQIAIEVHYARIYNSDTNTRNFNNLFWARHQLSLGELAVFFGHFADLGYGVASRDDNIQWGIDCCSEFNLIRVEKPAGC